jgi:hypothetical protein
MFRQGLRAIASGWEGFQKRGELSAGVRFCKQGVTPYDIKAERQWARKVLKRSGESDVVTRRGFAGD